MTGFKVMEKPKSCCSSKQIRIWWSLKFDEKYRLSSKTPLKAQPQMWLGFSACQRTPVFIERKQGFWCI